MIVGDRHLSLCGIILRADHGVSVTRSLFGLAQTFPSWRFIAGALVLLLATAAAVADTAVLRLEPGQSYQRMGRHLSYLEVVRREVDLAEARKRFAEGAFSPIGKDTVGFGMTPSAFWLRLEARNAGESSETWVLDTRRPHLQFGEIFVDQAGETRRILLESDRTPYTDRMRRERMLVAEPVTVERDETVVFWIHYASDDASILPLRLETLGDFAQHRIATAVRLAVFYAAGGVLLIFIAGFAVVARSRVALCYVGFLACLLAYNAQLDGVLFALLWPGEPEWNSVALHPIGMISIAFASLLAHEFVGAGRNHQVLSVLLLSNAFLVAVYAAAPLVVPLIIASTFAGVLAAAFLGLLLVTAFTVIRRGYTGSGFFVLGTVVLLAHAVMFSVFPQGGPQISEAGVDAIRRYGQILISGMFAAAVVQQAWVPRKRPAETTAPEEPVFEQPAAPSPDAREVLVSMQAAIEGVSTEIDSEDRSAQERVRRSISYLERAVMRALETTDPQNEIPEEERPKPAGPEVFPLSVVVDSVALMFASEAARKGLDFRYVTSSVKVHADPLVLVRMTRELVSNAVEYAEGGKVLLGVRRRGGESTIEVWESGPGLTADTIETALQPRKPGDDANGDSHGLSLVNDLATEYGWVFSIRSTPGKWSVFRIGGLSERRTPLRIGALLAENKSAGRPG